MEDPGDVRARYGYVTARILLWAGGSFALLQQAAPADGALGLAATCLAIAVFVGSVLWEGRTGGLSGRPPGASFEAPALPAAGWSILCLGYLAACVLAYLATDQVPVLSLFAVGATAAAAARLLDRGQG